MIDFTGVFESQELRNSVFCPGKEIHYGVLCAVFLSFGSIHARDFQ